MFVLVTIINNSDIIISGSLSQDNFVDLSAADWYSTSNIDGSLGPPEKCTTSCLFSYSTVGLRLGIAFVLWLVLAQLLFAAPSDE